MPSTYLYVASHCYGGLVRADYVRSVLALRAACAKADITLQLDLGGGEALISRGRAGMMAGFLASAATHLLFVDGHQAFNAAAVVSALEDADPLAWLGEGQLLVRREAAERISRAETSRQAGMADVLGVTRPSMAMVFDALVAPTGYVCDLAALTARWAALGGSPPRLA